jgi:hypothetical protein
MTNNPMDRIELLQGTLDMLILRTLQFGLRQLVNLTVALPIFGFRLSHAIIESSHLTAK